MEGGYWIGIDVSKDRLDYCVSTTGQPAHLPNTAAGRRTLVTRLRRQAPAGIVLESTGAYHILVTEALQDADLPVSVVTPQLIKWYRASYGEKAKTDRADARLLAAFGAARQPRPTRVLTPTERVLRELVARREDLVAQIGAEKNRLQVARDARIRRHIAAAVDDAERQRTAIEQEIDAVIASDPVLADRRAQLRTMPGVGWVTSVVLLAYLPELGELDRRQIAALAGLAPYADDSGTRQGKRHCRGGRPPVRRALYLAAVTCVTNARVSQTVYRDQYMATHPTKGAKPVLVAIARRMLVLLNAMIRDGLVWEETAIAQGHHPRPTITSARAAA
jgi:transposase